MVQYGVKWATGDGVATRLLAGVSLSSWFSKRFIEHLDLCHNSSFAPLQQLKSYLLLKPMSVG